MSVGSAGREAVEEREGGGEMEVLGRRGGVRVVEEREEIGDEVTGGGAGE